MLDLMMYIKCTLDLNTDVLKLYQNDDQGLHYNICRSIGLGIGETCGVGTEDNQSKQRVHSRLAGLLAGCLLAGWAGCAVWAGCAGLLAGLAGC